MPTKPDAGQYLYRNQPIEELDRETLIVALRSAIETIEKERQWSRTVHKTGMAFVEALK